nr:MAG TPA: hypothetical protein [Bacteriophage sp.]
MLFFQAFLHVSLIHPPQVLEGEWIHLILRFSYCFIV